MLDDVDIPVYYVVARHAGEEQIKQALDYFRIMPILCAIVSDMADVELALHITRDVIRTGSEAEAYDIAVQVYRETNRPSLVIGSAPVFNAVYSDGRVREVVTC